MKKTVTWTGPVRTESAKPKTRKSLKRVGPNNWWEKLRVEMKAAYMRAGIATCEYRSGGCWRDDGLGFAHSLKRRNIKTDAEKKETILACNYCHEMIESMSEEWMNRTVKRIISQRKTPVIL